MNISNIQKTLIKYYLYNQLGGSYKWTTLEHNGVLFPAEYTPHNIPLIYKNQKVKLNAEQEEAAMLYAKYIHSEYVQNKTFNKNFWNDWKKLLGNNSIIESLEDCDFAEYYNKIQSDKEHDKNIDVISSDEEHINSDKIEDNIESEKLNTKNIDVVREKKEEVLENETKLSRINYNITEKDEAKYKVALVDGKPQPVGNYRMEPPGIFLGRGDNPKIGKIKPRIYPEDVTLNIGKDAPIPKTLEGHKWGEIIHNRKVEWLASWKDIITGKIKYLWLGAQSDFKASSDKDKFDLARKLKRKIETIRRENDKNLNSENLKTKQIATAFYFIDKFALRVGNEKGKDETDTVGVTSLRVEHVDLLENNTISLDFLGKDSVRYYNKLTVEPDVYKNIIEFVKDKAKNEQIFDLIVSNDINKYLQQFMKNLTAKVFRTYNASYLFSKELKKVTKKYEGINDQELLLNEFNKANAKVAQLCNHQKNVGKSFKGQVDKMEESIKKVKSKMRKLKNSTSKTKTEKLNTYMDKLKKLKAKRDLKMELKNISLTTSKINYIDPRITIAFFKLHKLPIEKVFSISLQEKFKWAFDIDETYSF